MSDHGARITRENLAAAMSDASRKQAFVTPLFDLIAPRYDRFTRAFSYGMDVRWKRQLITWIARDWSSASRVHVLDAACGTGDLSLGVARALPNASVIGIDASDQMLSVAQSRADAADRVSFVRGDLTQLVQATGSVDVVTAGYAIRNVPDPRQALGEIARVLRPGGRLYVLDFFRPTSTVWRALFLGYLRAAGAAVGWWWHRAPAAYEYIAASIARFGSHDEFARWLKHAGFDVTATQPRLGGGVALIVARRR